MKLTAELKYSIADEITIESRSKADVVQDVFDEFVTHGIIEGEEDTKLAVKDDKEFLIQCLKSIDKLTHYENAADYILKGLQNYKGE